MHKTWTLIHCTNGEKLSHPIKWHAGRTPNRASNLFSHGCWTLHWLAHSACSCRLCEIFPFRCVQLHAAAFKAKVMLCQTVHFAAANIPPDSRCVGIPLVMQRQKKLLTCLCKTCLWMAKNWQGGVTRSVCSAQSTHSTTTEWYQLLCTCKNRSQRRKSKHEITPGKQNKAGVTIRIFWAVTDFCLSSLLFLSAKSGPIGTNRRRGRFGKQGRRYHVVEGGGREGSGGSPQACSEGIDVSAKGERGR